MEANQEYFAFISYSHKDEEWAKWLQHELEHYHLPASFNGCTDFPQELRPVFRVTDELGAGSLPEQIRQALNNSQNLIVICSPQTAKSVWVNQDVENFISLGKTERIFPFIVEGNSPSEFFPPALRDLPKDEERLGGDVSKNGRDAAFVKVVAGMLGVGFDSLWNLYEKEKAEEELKLHEQRDFHDLVNEMKQKKEAPNEIFISYSRKDIDKVKAIKEEIEQATFAKCWMDLDGISYDSPDFADVIVKAIDETLVFVFMLSEHSQKSRIAIGEITLAQKKKKHISIVNIDKCEMSDKFTILYSQHNLCDYSNNNQKEKLFNEICTWLGREIPSKKENQVKIANLFGSQDTLLQFGEQLYENQKYVEAYNVFNSLSQSRNIKAMYYEGLMLLKGIGTNPDIVKGEQRLLEAANCHIIDAQYDLGCIYEKGLYGIPQDLDNSLYWYKIAADQGHTYSIMAVKRLTRVPSSEETLVLYNEGKELLKDGKYSEAMKCFIEASKHEHTPSMREIASMYELGLGVKQSYNNTFEWLNKAIALGDIDAEYERKTLRHELTGQ